MKTKTLSASVILAVIMAGAAAGSCQSSDKTTGGNPAATAAPAAAAGATPSINIRYIDGDSVARRYKGSLDYENEHMKAMQRLDNAQQAKAAEIQKFAAQIEQKGRNNGYLTQESYQADMMKLQKMQQDAENYMQSLTRKTEVELMQKQTALNDTIEAFIKSYNASRGYDAILFKNAGIYFNPSLDITDEVVKGLNEQYAKGSESK